MNIDTKVQFGILIVAALSVGWSIGYYSRGDRIDTLEKQLSSYKDAESLNISETVKNLNNANNEISNNLAEIKNYQNWKDKKISLDKSIKELSNKLKDSSSVIDNKNNEITKHGKIIDKLNGIINEKQEIINSFYAVDEEFWLTKNSTQEIAGFDGIVGLKKVGSNSADVTFNNETQTLHAGNYIEVKIKESLCKIIISEISYLSSPEKVLFHVNCKKSNN